MKDRDIELNVTTGRPCAEDKLNRVPLVKTLTDICETLSESGAVLVLDGEWGAGKTTFVRIWRQMLEDNCSLEFEPKKDK